MKKLLVAGVALALAWLADPALAPADPASAHVVEVTTFISVAGIEDTAQLDRAIRSAVDDVVTRVVAFTPTVVVVMNGKVVGDRLYLRLLILDQEGEEAVGALAAEPNIGDKAEPGVVSPPDQQPESRSGGVARPVI